MNYRIDRVVSGENTLILRVSGRLHGPAVATLRDLLGKEKGKRVMDLKEVDLASREAVRFLGDSEAQGIELHNCPAYIREWIDREMDGEQR